MPKMHQIIAIESGTKTRVMEALTTMYKALQHTPGFDGMTKTYEPIAEDGQQLPPERQLVQLQAETVLSDVAEAATELYDVTATKDIGNCTAKANVEVGGQMLLKDIPVTHLIFLEKQLIHLQTVLKTVPTLDPAYSWTKDPAGGYRAETVKTQRTTKVAQVVQLAPPTEHHPEQAQLVNVDQLAGYWHTTKLSGAISADRKKELLDRVKQLINAVKFAREAANEEPVESQNVGKPIFEYLFR